MTAPLLNTLQMSKVLGVSYGWPVRAARKGKVPHIRVAGKYRFDAAEVLVALGGPLDRGEGSDE